MSVVTYFVETAEGYLNTAAETQFGAVAATVGTMLVLGTTLVVILVFINTIYQYRAMDGRTAFWLAVKIGLIGVFATNWVQFNILAASILSGIDSIAGSLVASVGGGSPGPSGTFAEEFDDLIAALGEYLNAAGSELNWMAGALLDTLGVLLLSILGGLAAFIVVASRLMIALLIGIAPIMIFLTLFEVTKDYFARWLSALISFAMYPIVVAGVFATITGVSRALLAELGDPEGASNIGALIPFFMMVLMAKGFIIATPFLVRAISGNIMMPALSAGSAAAMLLPEGSQAASKSTTGTPSEVRLARNTQLCARDNSSVCKRCQADPTLRGGQPHLLPATGPAQEPECLHSFQGWVVSAGGDNTEPNCCFGPRYCEAARQDSHSLRT